MDRDYKDSLVKNIFGSGGKATLNVIDISCRASDQERFTRMKTLGIDYTEEAITARIAGASRPSRQPKQRDDRIRLLYDLQTKQGGLQHWAKIQNLKLAAKTFAWLEERGIDNYADLESKAATITEKRDSSHAEIKTIDARSAELALVMKHAATYRKLKPIYDQYRRSGDKEKFMRGHESEIILFEAAARELKRLGAVPLPTAESIKAELAVLNAKNEKLLAEYKTARSEAREYETVKQNVDMLLSVPNEEEPKRTHHIE